MTLSPQTRARIREQYSSGVPVADIRREHKVTSRQLYDCLAGGPDGEPVIPRRRSHRAPPGRRNAAPGNSRRTDTIHRLWRTAEKQVREIERRLGNSEQEPTERERDARMLAVLVKTLRELSALDDATRSAAQNAQPRTGDEYDDPVPRDIDEFRQELARRIEAFVGSKSDAAIPGDAES